MTDMARAVAGVAKECNYRLFHGTMGADMDLRKKLFIGSLGALSPILINLLVIDLDLVLANAKLLTVVSYVIRVVALCAAACLVVYLNGDEDKPIKVFQLGLAAPALLTGIINGVSLSNNVVNQRTAFEMPAIVSSAFAQPGTINPPKVEDCLKHDSTAGQQVLKGLLGILPEDRWNVSTSSNLQLQSAVDEVQDIKRRFPTKFHPKICAPISSDDKYYRVIIGQNLTREAASKLRDEALAAGLSKSTWLWSPVSSK